MKNYVISLATATDRREHIKAEFGKQGIEFEFFDAVTPKELDALADELQLGRVLTNIQLTPTEKACFFSHIAVMQQAIDDNLPYVAIFEDDVYLGEKAHDFLGNSAYPADNHINLLKLETFLQYRKLDKQHAITLPNTRTAYPLNEYHLGMAGYIISHTTAVQFLAFVRQLSDENIIPIDRILFDEFMNVVKVHQLTPAICIQEHIKNPNNINLISSLEQERQYQQQHKPKRTLSQKIKGELGNAYRKTFGKFSRILVEFK